MEQAAQGRQDTVMVLTSKTMATMFREGGTGDWKANSRNVQQCAYVVGVRNGNRGWEEQDREAFFVGKVSGVAETHDKRIVIKFSEYAEIKIADAWPYGNRNPVRYTNIAELNIDSAKLTWKPFPTEMVEAPEARPLTINEAKRGIARTLGIPPESIEITIRA